MNLKKVFGIFFSLIGLGIGIILLVLVLFL